MRRLIHGVGVWEAFSLGELVAVFSFGWQGGVLMYRLARNDGTLSCHLIPLNFIILPTHNHPLHSSSPLKPVIFFQ